MNSSYINNDSTAVYSTHPSRSFKYGYAYSKEECAKYSNEILKYYELKNGDVVADVGGASGWIDGIASTQLDSVTFYVEDINSVYANQSELDKVVKYYSAIREKPQTNNFHFIMGTKFKTKLPDSTFDKIILLNTFHEMKRKRSMIKDIATKLKPGGRLYIMEYFSSEDHIRTSPGCGIRALMVNSVVRKLVKRNLYLVRMTYPEKAALNCLAFSNDIKAAGAFEYESRKANLYLQELDKLKHKEVVNDSIIVYAVIDTVKNHLKEIHATFESVEFYINDFANDLMSSKKYSAAMNIYNGCLRIYQESDITYFNIGESYLKQEKYDEALLSYTKALELDPLDSEIKKKILQVKLLLEKKETEKTN